tara:strand:- start:356 stop:571 length:216 start_codon:yes stop_codon:yes gene_type:complete
MNPKFYSRKKNNSSPIIDTSEGLKSQESSFADQTKKSREQSEIIDSSSSNQKAHYASAELIVKGKERLVKS